MCGNDSGTGYYMASHSVEFSTIECTAVYLSVSIPLRQTASQCRFTERFSIAVTAQHTLLSLLLVILSDPRCSQASLGLRNVPFNSSSAFLESSQCTDSSEGVFQILQYMTSRIDECWPSWELCSRFGKSSEQICWRLQSRYTIQTAVVLTVQ